MCEQGADQSEGGAGDLVTGLVQRENERLTRLLRNLYQEFRLGWGDRAQLYEHICRELAQYFHCDCCELYLVRHDLPERESGQPQARERLVLAAAFGPWEQALRPRFVRRVVPTQYALDQGSHTATRFRNADPWVDICRADMQTMDSPMDSHSANVEWHWVWRRDNLYSISRTILSCPILRHRSQGRGQPYPIGLLKLENRRPILGRAYESDWPTEKLYLAPYFGLFAVVAYLQDLRNRLNETGDNDPWQAFFAPLNDADGWRQHYQEHRAGWPYFEAVREWQEARQTAFRKSHRSKPAQKQAASGLRAGLSREYKQAADQLARIMDLVVEVEVLLQELRTAGEALRGKAAAAEIRYALDRLRPGAPAPSLFNTVGLVKSADRGKVPWLQAIISKAISSRRPASDFAIDPDASCCDLAKLVSEGEAAKRSGERAAEDHLWDRLMRTFRSANPQRGGLLESSHRTIAADLLYELLEDVAGRIRANGAPVAASAQSSAAVATRQCAYAVLNPEPKERLAASGSAGLPARAERRRSAETQAVRRLAYASAAACLYGHAFDPRIDAARLLAIQSHVSQVLDNYLMDKARLLALGLSFDHIEILGLTEASIDELERLRKLLQDLARGLETADHRVAALRSPTATPEAEVRVEDLHQVLGELVGQAVDGPSAPVGLLAVRFRGSPTEARLRCGELYDEVVGALQADHPVRWRRCGIVLRAQLVVPKSERLSCSNLGDQCPKDRPVPHWLFRLNLELEAACTALSQPVAQKRG